MPETIKSPDMFVLKYDSLRCHQAWYVNFTNQSSGKLVRVSCFLHEVKEKKNGLPVQAGYSSTLPHGQVDLALA